MISLIVNKLSAFGWVGIIWITTTTVCLWIGIIYLMAWYRNKSLRAYLFIALTAFGTAGLSILELWLMRTDTVFEFGEIFRWGHVPSWLVVVSLVGFTRTNLEAGRLWLGRTIVGLRTLSLIINFAYGTNLQFIEITYLRQVRYLGEYVTVAEGTPNPWMLTGQATVILLVVFMMDAALTVWRREGSCSKLFLLISMIFFMLMASVQSITVFWGFGTFPMNPSLFSFGMVAIMVWEMNNQLIQASKLAHDLRKSEIQYRDVFEGAVEGIFRMSAQGIIQTANSAMARILGYDSPKEILESERPLCLEQSEHSRFLRLLEDHGSVSGYECRLLRKDGTKIWVLLNGRAVKEDNGRLSYFNGFLDDISLRKDAMRSQHESTERLRFAAEAAGFGIYAIDYKAGTALYSSIVPHLQGLTDDTQFTLDSDLVPTTIHPADRPGFIRAVRDSSDPRGTGIFDVHFRVYRSDGQLKWMRARGSTTFDEQGPHRLALFANGILLDIDKWKKAEEARLENEEKYRLLFERSTDAIYIIDALTGRFIDANNSAEILTGRSVNELKQLTIQDISPMNCGERLGKLRASSDVSPVVDEIEYFRNDGTSRIALVSGTRLDGNTFYEIAHDITDRKKNSDLLLQQRVKIGHMDRVFTMGQLASALAHELNQPLCAILRNSEAGEMILNDPSPDLEELQHILADIQKDNSRAGQVIDKMRFFIKFHKPEFIPLDIRLVVKESTTLLEPDADRRGVLLSLKIYPTPVSVLGDQVQLQQVLINLIMNAMDASAECPQQTRLVSVQVRAAEDRAEVIVTDNGPGVSPELLSRIFEEYFTTKPNGLGMGLAITRGIIEAHNGRIWAENIMGGGAMFVFSLPMANGDGRK